MDKHFGLIGEKLGHSYSPEIHREIFKEIGIEGKYSIYEIKKELLKNALEEFKMEKIDGFNVTIPYKVDIIKYLDFISDEVEKIGAVNTVVIRDGKAAGYNTDYYGFGAALNKYNIDIKNKKALILGTGGASRAVANYLANNGIHDIALVSREKDKNREKYKEYRVINYDEIKYINDFNLIINCTPIGMFPKCNEIPIDKKLLCKFETAFDLIYNPVETLFLKESKKINLKTADGLFMLIAQGVKSEEIWNNIKIDEKIIDKIYEKIKEKVTNN